MQVDMHHVEAHITRTGSAQHRVQVGTVIIHQSTHLMDEFLYLRNLSFKESQRIGIGHHHRSDTRTFALHQLDEIIEVHQAFSRRLHLHDLQSTDSCRCRVRTVSRVRHDDQTTCVVTTMLMIFPDDHQSRQFSVSPCIGFEGKSMHTRQFAQGATQHCTDSLSTSCGLCRL